MRTWITASAQTWRATCPARWCLHGLLATVLLAAGGHGLAHLLEHGHQHAGARHHGDDHGPGGHLHDGTHLVGHHHGDGDAGAFDPLLATRARATPSSGDPMPAPILAAVRIEREERAAPRAARAPPPERLYLIETVVLTI